MIEGLLGAMIGASCVWVYYNWYSNISAYGGT